MTPVLSRDGSTIVTPYTLVIGNKNYSSWSLRVWLFLRESGIDFSLVRIPMFTSTFFQDVARYSPAGRVPVLIDGEQTVWDSSAIFLYVQERQERSVGWPPDSSSRAHAQSICGEMHSGFLAIRGELPQNIRSRRRRRVEDLSVSCRQQIDRVDEIWSECRASHGSNGPWLFGAFSLADIMFAPVALRFLTYGIPLSPPAAEFQQSVCENVNIQDWVAASGQEVEAIPFIDNLVPADDSPLTLG